MPGVALHLIVAHRTLDALVASGQEAPFDPGDPVAVNAFRQGAIGPDLGYFPGGFRTLSDLSHCVRSGVLTRSLVDGARSDVEAAFAWGWLTHVLADCSIHPWIGRGVGEVLCGRRDRFVDGSSEPLEHLRIEVGVDATFAPRCRAVRSRHFEPLFDVESVEFLVEAYARTYGIDVPHTVMLTSHRAAGIRAGQALSTLSLLGALMAGSRRGRILGAARRLLQRAYASDPLRGASLAFVNPIPPRRWLIRGILRAIDALPKAFLDLLRTGAVGLADHNLDTGRPSALEAAHPGTRRALAALSVLERQARRASRGHGRRFRPIATVASRGGVP